MSRATHFIETYQNSKGEIKTAPLALITWTPLGMLVKEWKTFKIINVRINENSIKRTQSN